MFSCNGGIQPRNASYGLTNVLLIKSIPLKGPVFRDNKSYNSRQ